MAAYKAEYAAKKLQQIEHALLFDDLTPFHEGLLKTCAKVFRENTRRLTEKQELKLLEVLPDEPDPTSVRQRFNARYD